MSLAMTRSERDAFLTARETGVMVVRGGGQLFAMPVWYDYRPGGNIGFVINEGSRRLEAIDDPDCELGLTVHHEDPPVPAFVTVFGRVAVNRPMEPQDLALVWPVMCRALGGEDLAARYVELGGDAFFRGIEAPSSVGSRRVELEPTRWTSCDYAKAGEKVDLVFGPR